MTPINHAQARAFIQAAADNLLNPSQQQILQAHLQSCSECQAYAAEFQALENTLTRTLQDRWDGPQLHPQAVNRLVQGVQNGLAPRGGNLMKTTGKFVFGLAGLGVMALLILGVILGIGSFRVYSRLDNRLPSVSPITIWFENPQQGSTLPSGNPLLITAESQGPYPILYMQLETDGQVVGVIGAPSSQGVTPFSADFNWQPGEMKTYKLTARAFDSMGNEAQSTMVLNIADPNQVTEQDIQTAYQPVGPHAPSGLGEGGGGGSPPPLEEEPPYQPSPTPTQPVLDLAKEIDPGKPWAASIPGWFGFLFNTTTKPAAPGIPATAVEGCTPRIWISDNSDNEEGFRVFRRDPGSLAFIEIAIEAPYNGPVFTFEDEESDLYGAYEYQVSAFNQQGESFSNISEPVQVDSPNCQPENKLVIQVDLAKVFTDKPFDMGYCYYSLDGEHWLRQPSDPGEFFQDGLTQDEVLGLFQLKVAQQQLDLECWGWQGGSLQLIGKWHFDDVLQDHLELGLAQMGDGIQTYGGGGMDGPWDPELPVPYAWLGTSPEECGAYSNIPNPFILGLICGDVADDLDFVLWGFICPSGGCPEAEDIVGYNVYDTLGSFTTPVQFIDAPATIYFPFDPSACTPRLISITALIEIDGEVHESLPSNQVIYSPEDICDYIAGNEPRMYRVTWDSVDFSVGDIDDDPDIEDDAEGFGSLALVTGTGHEVYWHMPMVDGFEDESDENPYFFSGLLLSQHDFPCTGVFCYVGGGIGASTGNNSANFPLFIGESFYVRVYLVEYDDDQQHDVLCSIDPYTDNLNWNPNAIGGPGWVTTVSRTKHHNYASCKVTVTIEGLP